MPLPVSGSNWPPTAWQPAFNSYAENNAWYIGDLQKLHEIYSQDKRERATYRHRGEVRSGGVVGAFNTFWYGRKNPARESRARLHVPAAADLAALSSDLMFSDHPKITFGDDTGTTEGKARLDIIANSDEAFATLNESGEIASALGATVMTVQWDQTLADSVWIGASGADVSIPEFRQGRLTAVNLFTEFIDGQIYYRHLERHEPGRIIHQLYAGTASNIGRPVPLQERPETEYLATFVDAYSSFATGIPYLTASYMKNMPTRRWRTDGTLSPVGRSDFDGNHGLFDALDETWSSLMRDIDLGRARLVVPEAYLETRGAGSGADFDTDREIFTPVNIGGAADSKSITSTQFKIRVSEHLTTAQAIYQEILRSAGYSPSVWGEATGVAQTATESDNRDKATERTRDKKALYAKSALAQITRSAFALDGILFPGKGGGLMEQPPTVEFPPVSQQSPSELATTAQMLRSAELLSQEVGIAMVHPDWEKPQIQDEVARLQAEKPPSPIDIGSFGRSEPDQRANEGEQTPQQ